ncbi:DUF4238 domain-containing protein [Agromyces sp. GXQ0307]|uniref:DUF4238 domain-containing protein n=1 Tax=Agromyces sp. GXQ0307 TaxID=3377835 RepID=UPI00383A19D8
MVRRAHMVSAGYIRAWADEKDTVDVIDLQHDRGFPSAVSNATVVSYAYDPEVMQHDLENDYARIEDRGIPVIEKLRNGETTVTPAEMGAMIGFLDMHLDRGRYADQTKIRTPAAVLMTGGQVEHRELNLGDRLLLSRSLPDVIRLADLRLEEWEWRVNDVRPFRLATGDGAVMLWASASGADICTVSFPLSPTQLLVIGKDLPPDIPLNVLLAEKCRRWLVGERGVLNLNFKAQRSRTERQL